jgi:hypothetical protein
MKAEMEKPNFKSVRGPFKYGSNHIDWLHIAYHCLRGPLRRTTKEPFVLLLPGKVTHSTARRCSSLLISVNACARHIEIAGAMSP